MRFLALAMLAAFAVPATQAATFAGGTLPGRLLVNARSGPSHVFDLQTGRATALPRSSGTQDPDKDRWTAASSVALRWYLNVGLSGLAPVTVFDVTNWRPRRQLAFPTEFRAPIPSPDGRYLLAFWSFKGNGETAEDEKLTVFDAASGKPVKRSSQLDGVLLTGSPAAWLPDGRYVYLAGNKLYASSPTSSGSQLLATLALPGASTGKPVSFGSTLAVSPDGRRLAFTWAEPARRTSTDTHIWIVNLDGTGLRRLTSAPDSHTALNYVYGSPAWAPDGRWIAGVLYMSGTSIAPVFPPDDTVAPAWQIAGVSGCASNPVFVLPADARDVAIPWPRYDPRYNLKVSGSKGLQWLSACEGIAWLR
jgi:hypothetical protein